jgi:hypothetical protein
LTWSLPRWRLTWPCPTSKWQWLGCL